MTKIFNFNGKSTYIDYIEGEEWRVATGYMYYLISNYGRVYSLKQHKMLKQQMTNRGYLIVKIKSYSGKFKHVKVHRLVAGAFIANPECKKVVHHIDGNPKNNKVENLMWVTNEEHIQLHREMREQRKAKNAEMKRGDVNE